MTVAVRRVRGIVCYAIYITPKFNGYTFWLGDAEHNVVLPWTNWQQAMDEALLKQSPLMRFTNWKHRTSHGNT